jgi:hypothetical protein
MLNHLPKIIDHSQLDAWKDDLIAMWMVLNLPLDFQITQPRTTYLAAERAGVKAVLTAVLAM